MIDKDTIIGLARNAGLAGPEIVEFRSLSGFAFWLFAGSAGNRAFIEIDPVLDGEGSVRQKIAVLKDVPQAGGNQLVGAAPIVR